MLARTEHDLALQLQQVLVDLVVLLVALGGRAAAGGGHGQHERHIS